MRELILASRSKARQKILRQAGIRFRAVTTNVKEDTVIRGSCEELVMNNAFLKACAAARNRSTGVIIGADTVVLCDGKIIGKPKDLHDAARTLKLLSRKPQWVYTGLAVIDIDNKRMYADHEATKVYMCHLSDAEIRSYFRKVSPLDKAGSFDIQGLGGIFIDRIEGCYYNVVGLPLAKLARILKKTGLNIWI
ncbi:MAG: Maf family protein [Candidatus Omnitrophota bacterium]